MAFSMLHLHTSSPHKNFTTKAVPVAGNPRHAPIRVVCGTSPLRLLQNGENHRRLSTRRYCSDSPPDLSKDLPYNELLNLRFAVCPSVVPLLSYIADSETLGTPYSTRSGTGVFVDPKLIVTSAQVVGIVSTENDSDRHHCFIGRTIGSTMEQKVFRTRPVAVNFARDVAVLEVVETKGKLPPPCALADAVAAVKTNLLRIARREKYSVLSILRVRQRTDRAEAPWPLDGELEWVDYGGGDGALLPVCGSPWFNFQREIVGMASWDAETADGRTISYVVPPSGIRSVVEYAKNKGANDPIVMDTWINNAHPFPELDINMTEVINSF